MKARGALVDLLVALGEARLDREILAEPDQGIEQEMRHLERGARQLLMRIERGGVGIVGHAQGLGLRPLGGESGDKRDGGSDEKQTHGRKLCRQKGAAASTPLCLRGCRSIQSAVGWRSPFGAEQSVQGFFVTGTDTDVGKTVVAAWLVARLGASYWKPVQAGTIRRPIPKSCAG